MKKEIVVSIFLITLVFSMTFASAGWWDGYWAKVSGKSMELPAPKKMNCATLAKAYGYDLNQRRGNACLKGWKSLGKATDTNICCGAKSPSCSSVVASKGYTHAVCKSAACPTGYQSLGSAYNCKVCCGKQKVVTTTSTPKLLTCSQLGSSKGYSNSELSGQKAGASCPKGYDSLGASSDAPVCCAKQKAVVKNTNTKTGATQTCNQLAVGAGYTRGDCQGEGNCPKGKVEIKRPSTNCGNKCCGVK